MEVSVKKLIEYPDQLIVGHAISNDAGFLRSACRRYKLDPINFKFADSQRMFSEFANIRKSISLETAGENLNVEKPKYLHKSDDDSELTMNLVKGMCKQLDCSLEELIEFYFFLFFFSSFLAFLTSLRTALSFFFMVILSSFIAFS